MLLGIIPPHKKGADELLCVVICCCNWSVRMDSSKRKSDMVLTMLVHELEKLSGAKNLCNEAKWVTVRTYDAVGRRMRHGKPHHPLRIMLHPPAQSVSV